MRTAGCCYGPRPGSQSAAHTGDGRGGQHRCRRTIRGRRSSATGPARPSLEFKEEEAALYPDLTHPRTVYLREDIVCQALDRWIVRAFAPDRLSATIEALTHASATASTAETQTPELAQARQAIKESERRLACYQAALDAGADPVVVTQWINEAQRNKDAAQKKLDAHPAATRKKHSPLDARQIRRITESLGGIAQRIQTAAVEKKGPLYDALDIAINYENATRTAIVRSRPSSPYRQSFCPRGESTADDTVLVAQGRFPAQSAA
ncbi:hypothetical protein AB0478_41810 [Streptomyces sp. NPDC051917]|uniref:hypothetical protein n=1 Tax=Streptomyces sp. NPDC051917 TaxID=3154754 RepID=UPI003453DAD7